MRPSQRLALCECRLTIALRPTHLLCTHLGMWSLRHGHVRIAKRVIRVVGNHLDADSRQSGASAHCGAGRSFPDFTIVAGARRGSDSAISDGRFTAMSWFPRTQLGDRFRRIGACAAARGMRTIDPLRTFQLRQSRHSWVDKVTARGDVPSTSWSRSAPPSQRTRFVGSVRQPYFGEERHPARVSVQRAQVWRGQG
jgi:hypothetical protein